MMLVLPAPRKPVITVAGIFCATSLAPRLVRGGVCPRLVRGGVLPHFGAGSLAGAARTLIPRTISRYGVRCRARRRLPKIVDSRLRGNDRTRSRRSDWRSVIRQVIALFRAGNVG